MSEHQRKEQEARTCDNDLPGVAKLELPDPAQEQIGNGKIEEAPKDVDRRGGQAFPRRGRKGALEGMARDPVAEMGKRVREECSAEEVSQVVVPAHDDLHLGAHSAAVSLKTGTHTQTMTVDDWPRAGGLPAPVAKRVVLETP